MKRFKVILIICLAICFCLSLCLGLLGCDEIDSSTSESESSPKQEVSYPFKFSRIDGGVQLLDVFEKSLAIENGVMKIPSQIDGKNVVKIDFNGRLCDLDIEYVIIPSTVKEIGEKSFYDLQELVAVIFEKDSRLETIGNQAFSQCSELSTFVLPNSVKMLGEDTFVGCSSLTYFYVGASVERINAKDFINSGINNFAVDSANANYSAIDGVLFDNTQTVLVAYPYAKVDSSYVVPSSVTNILSSAFLGNTNLTSVDLNSASYVGENAFANCVNLLTITGDNVNNTSSGSFLNTAWYSANENNGIFDLGYVLFKYNGTAEVLDLCGYREIEKYAFVQRQESGDSQYTYNTTLRTVKVDGALRRLESNVFYNCTALEELYIFYVNDIEISEYAFDGLSEGFKAYVQLQLVDEYSQEFENVEFCPITTKVNYYSGEQKVYEDIAYWEELYTASYTPDYQGGYRFEGWFEDEDFTSRFVQREFLVKDSEFNLYAKIIEGGYRIAYLKEKNYIFGYDHYEYGDTIELKEFPRSGYVFVGWFWDEECTDLVEESELVGIYGDLVFYGKWKDISVTFISPVGNGTDGGDYCRLFYDKTALLQQDYPILVYKNAQFYGWYDGERGTGNLIIDAQGNILVDEIPNYLYAGWQTFTITYSCDYGVELPENPTIYSYYDGEIELLEPTLENYRFVGWFCGDDVVTRLDKNIAGDVVLVAHFELL